MTKRKTMLAAWFVACALVMSVAVAANATTSQAAAPPPTTAVVDSDGPVDGSEVATAKPARAEETEADVLEREALAEIGDRFAGISVDEKGALVVHVKDVEGEARPASIAGRPVQYETHSLEELKQAQTKLDLEYEAIEDAAGITLAAWRADPATNALLVDVVAPDDRTSTERDALASFLPDVRIVVEPVDGLSRLSARHNDLNGWGGARIIDVGGTACTAGFAWINQYGQNMMTTAGHCAITSAGHRWNNGVLNWYGAQFWNAMMGSSPWRNDTAVLSRGLGTYQGLFYVNGSHSSGAVYVNSWLPGSQLGVAGIRTSGAVTGEAVIGPGNVLSEGSTVVFSGAGAINGLTFGECFTAPGDSGGPVFRVLSGGTNIQALGTLTGYPVEQQGNRCWYTPTSIIAAHHGGAPLGN